MFQSHLLQAFLSVAPSNRLFLGMPAFGRTWVLADSPVPGGLGARTELGALFSDAGMLSYQEVMICGRRVQRLGSGVAMA